jgi:hypothetical protein
MAEGRKAAPLRKDRTNRPLLTSMVGRGSTVRVCQRASQKDLHTRVLRRLNGQRSYGGGYQAGTTASWSPLETRRFRRDSVSMASPGRLISDSPTAGRFERLEVEDYGRLAGTRAYARCTSSVPSRALHGSTLLSRPRYPKELSPNASHIAASSNSTGTRSGSTRSASGRSPSDEAISLRRNPSAPSISALSSVR